MPCIAMQTLLTLLCKRSLGPAPSRPEGEARQFSPAHKLYLCAFLLQKEDRTMLPYLTDYENDRRLFRPRVVNAILVLLPFMVLYRATELWFSDMYWFDYMKQGHYGLMWAGLCLLSVRKPRFALVAAYGDAAAIVIASFTGDALREYNKLTATPEDYIKSCEGKLAHHAPWIWIQLFFTVIVLYVAYVRQIEPRIKARRERRGK